MIKTMVGYLARREKLFPLLYAIRIRETWKTFSLLLVSTLPSLKHAVCAFEMGVGWGWSLAFRPQQRHNGSQH